MSDAHDLFRAIDFYEGLHGLWPCLRYARESRVFEYTQDDMIWIMNKIWILMMYSCAGTMHTVLIRDERVFPIIIKFLSILNNSSYSDILKHTVIAFCSWKVYNKRVIGVVMRYKERISSRSVGIILVLRTRIIRYVTRTNPAPCIASLYQ